MRLIRPKLYVIGWQQFLDLARLYGQFAANLRMIVRRGPYNAPTRATIMTQKIRASLQHPRTYRWLAIAPAEVEGSIAKIDSRQLTQRSAANWDRYG